MKKKINKKYFIIAGCVLGLIFVLLIVRTIFYHKTYEYKFGKLGYSSTEINEFRNKLTETSRDYLLSLEYNKNITNLMKEKYFMEKNLKGYIEYMKTSDKNLTDVVSIINVGANKNWYSNTKPTDLSKGNLMLTNKFNRLDNTYNSDSMVKVSNQYSYGDDQLLTSDTYSAFIEMFNAAKKEDLTLIINSSFRSYEDQEEIYNFYKETKGENEADRIAAKAGFSEHQTGMCVDIMTYNSKADNFEEFDEFKWLQNNAYKYGFILRYPKDKEYLTGYNYESWHYRYVGKEAATYIHENGITFDEYYAYFIDK